MRTWNRLIATVVAIRIHSNTHHPPVIEESITTAKPAAEACPLGNEEVLGFRTVRPSAPCSVGRCLRNSRLMPWLTMRLSMPRRTERRMISRNSPVRSPRVAPVRCQIRLQSPSVLAATMIELRSAMLRAGRYHESSRESSLSAVCETDERFILISWTLCPTRRFDKRNVWVPAELWTPLLICAVVAECTFTSCKLTTFTRM